MTQQQVTDVYGKRLQHLREVEEGHDGHAKIEIMRAWVKQVAPILEVGEPHSREGPLRRSAEAVVPPWGLDQVADPAPFVAQARLPRGPLRGAVRGRPAAA